MRRTGATGSLLLLLLSLLGGCGGESAAPAPRAPASKAEAALTTGELVRVGTLADHPDAAVHVALLEDGSIVVPSGDGSFGAFEAFLTDLAATPGQREEDGSCRANLVLRVHPRLPWEAVAWTLMACVAPQVKAYRIHFAVRPEDDGPEGSMAAWLPRDGGPGTEPARLVAVPDWRVTLIEHDQSVDPGTALVEFQKAFAEAGRNPDVGATVAVRSSQRVAAGHVLRTVDLLHRAGLVRVNFEGIPLPAERDARGKGGHADWLRAYVAAHPLSKPGFRLKFLGKELTGVSSKPLVALPPVPRQRRVTPPADAPRDVPEEVVEGPVEEAPAAPPAPPGDGGAAAPPRGPDDNSVVGTGGGAGGAFKGRGGQRSEGAAGGAAPKRDEAVLRALRWLAAHQAEDGGWKAEGFPAWCDGKPATGARPDGVGKASYDVGVTGLALCAYLGAGHTNRGDGEFAKVVRKGFAYLKNVQDAEGCFGPRSNLHYIYNHAIAATAMVEVYGMTLSPVFKGSAQLGLDFVMLARNPYFAWRYGIKPGENDTSITGWMLLCLESARRIDADAESRGLARPLALDEEAFDGIRAWIEKMTDPDTGRVGYAVRGSGPARVQEQVDRFPQEKSEAMTAVGVLARVFLGEDPATSAPIVQGAALLARTPPAWKPDDGSIDLVHWVFGSLALAQVGGATRTAWEKALDEALVAHQRLDGEACSFQGSWDPLDPWGSEGGRVYSTAMGCLACQAERRYARSAAPAGK